MDADMTDMVFCERCGDNTPSRLELTLTDDQMAAILKAAGGGG